MKAFNEKINGLKKQIKEVYDVVETEVRSLSEEESTNVAALEAELRGLEDTVAKMKEAKEKMNFKEEVVKADEVRDNELETKELEMSNAFRDYLRYGNEQEYRRLTATIATTTGIANQGVTIPVKLQDAIMKKLYEVAPLAQMVKTINASGTIRFLKQDTIGTAAFLAENTDVTETDLTFTSVDINQNRLATLVTVTQELLNDSAVNFEAYISEVLGMRMGFALNNALITGTGTSNQPEGLLNAPAAQQITTATTLVITADELLQMYYDMHPTLLDGCVWIMSRSTLQAVAKLKDGQGNYLLTPDYTKTPGGYQILGKRVIISDVMPNMSTVGNKAVVFANPAEAITMNVKKGVNVQRLNEVYATRGAVGFISNMYLDAKITRPEAIRILKIK